MQQRAQIQVWTQASYLPGQDKLVRVPAPKPPATKR